jgi:hypothetical protein
MRLFRAVAACVVVVCLGWPAAAGADQLFSPTSYRNTPLPDNAAVDPLSVAYVTDLVNKVNNLGAHVEWRNYGIPVYTVGSGLGTDTQVWVNNPGHNPCGQFTYGSPCLVTQWTHVPLPATASPSPGTDRTMVVYQPQSPDGQTMWEFWNFDRNHLGTQAEAVYGGRIQHLENNPGYYEDVPPLGAGPGRDFGAAASHIPLLAGLQRLSEMQAGAITHMVSFAYADPQKGTREPAHGNGDNGNTNTNMLVPKEGTCFRLPRSLNLSSLGLTQYGLMLAHAVQDYGMIMTDRTSIGVGFTAEQPTDGSDPYSGVTGIFHGLDNSNGGGGVLHNFPFNQLQALTADACKA